MQAHTSAHVECIGLAALDRAGPWLSGIRTTVPTTVEFIADARLRVDQTFCVCASLVSFVKRAIWAHFPNLAASVHRAVVSVAARWFFFESCENAPSTLGRGRN